jgi:xanthine dehydrogenase iron-sulfur cluster and FAD-binding subunit A
MVVDTSLVLRAGDVEREVSLVNFYHDYMVNDLQPGEFISRIRIPLPSDGAVVKSQKWSKRFDQDISAICTAYRLILDDGKVEAFQMACGGLAATVRRAERTEAAIIGEPWTRETIEKACAALCQDFAPISDMREVRITASHIDVGAAATLSEAIPAIVEAYPGFIELFRRFASPPIRNAGTLGGNIANGSPIGDSMAALMVVDASLVLRAGDVQREVALVDFYHDYMVNDLQPGEFVSQIRIPLPSNGAVVTSQKWSKRFDQDISAICTAYRLILDDGKVEAFQMACGGLAATVRRAERTEAAIIGEPWTRDTIEKACAALSEDFAPISDMRASADIRLLAVQNLLRRFHAETIGDGVESVYNYGR